MNANHGTVTAYSHHGCRCLPCTEAGMRSRRRGLPPGDPRHGTSNGYTNLGCRCDECRAANTTKVAEDQARRAARGLPPGDPRHGTSNGYGNYRCRCDECRTAATRDRYTTATRRRERQQAALRAAPKTPPAGMRGEDASASRGALTP